MSYPFYPDLPKCRSAATKPPVDAPDSRTTQAEPQTLAHIPGSPRASSTIPYLPEEIWLQILSLLHPSTLWASARPTCRQFLRIAEELIVQPEIFRRFTIGYRTHGNRRVVTTMGFQQFDRPHHGHYALFGAQLESPMVCDTDFYNPTPTDAAKMAPR